MISFKLINLAAVLTQHFHSASALLTVQTAVRLSVRPSFRHIPVLCPDEWRYDRVGFSFW